CRWPTRPRASTPAWPTTPTSWPAARGARPREARRAPAAGGARPAVGRRSAFGGPAARLKDPGRRRANNGGMNVGRRDLLAAGVGAAVGAAAAGAVGSPPPATGVQVEIPGQAPRAFTGAPIRLFVPSVSGEDAPAYDAEHPFF